MTKEQERAQGRLDLGSFKLMTIDQDGTIYKRDPLAVIAKELGRKRALDRLERLRRARKISPATSLRGQFEILDGMTIRELESYMRKVRPIKGLRAFLGVLRALGLRTVLLTDNPSCVADFALKFGFDGIICSRSELSVTGVIGRTYPLVNKATALRGYCKRNGISRHECLHVGNGENDISVFKMVRASIALNPESDKVRYAADFSLETDTILDLMRLFSFPSCLSSPLGASRPSR